MRSDISLRPITFLDIDALRNVKISLHDKKYYVGDITIDFARPALASTKIKRISSYIFHGICKNSQIIGYISSVFRVNHSRIFIINMVIDSQLLGRGYGGAALRKYLKYHCGEFEKTECHIELSNIRSLRLFISHGFKLQSFDKNGGLIFSRSRG